MFSIALVSILLLLALPNTPMAYGDKDHWFIYHTHISGVDIIFTYEFNPIEAIEFEYQGQIIYLFIIDDWQQMPENTTCVDPRIAGCSTVMFTNDIERINMIILMVDKLQYVDQWGQKPLIHELRHIICLCNWHEGKDRLYV